MPLTQNSESQDTLLASMEYSVGRVAEIGARVDDLLKPKPEPPKGPSLDDVRAKISSM